MLSSSSSSSGSDAAYLSEVHKAQLASFVKFFEQQRQRHVAALSDVAADAKELRVLEEMYTRDEVGEVLDGVVADVKANLEEDLERFTHQSVLYLQQVFLQAEGHGVTLKVDTATLDDQRLLAGVKEMEGPSSTNKLMALPKVEKKASKLAPLTGTVDVKLLKQVKDLQQANERLQNRFDKLQTQCQKAMKENTSLRQQVAEKEKTAASANANLEQFKSTTAASAEQQIQELQNQLKSEREAHDREVEVLKDQLQEKVNASKQFQELKKMVQKKNALIKQLREAAQSNT
eukprot:TRINITY_DN66191_c4_g7_i1.p1 TRINITY_DN66191_c4_g7~~TRINITY_DN66191_c4_g7_i1.p1  ORF type:complete len:289 (+),score=148.78 TRINITY_DN66191_c4_g7_i1:61-927(+)